MHEQSVSCFADSKKSNRQIIKVLFLYAVCLAFNVSTEPFWLDPFTILHNLYMFSYSLYVLKTSWTHMLTNNN